MTTAIIVRLYAGFVALCLTLVFSCGLNGVLYPRPNMPDDVFIGLFIMTYSLPMAAMSWRAAIWWKPDQP